MSRRTIWVLTLTLLTITVTATAAEPFVLLGQVGADTPDPISSEPSDNELEVSAVFPDGTIVRSEVQQFAVPDLRLPDHGMLQQLVPRPVDRQPSMQHGADGEFPVIADPNEGGPGMMENYHKARDLILQGDWVQAELGLQEAVEEFPESRHLHELLAEVYWYYYRDLGLGEHALTRAADHATKALELSIRRGGVQYRMAEVAADALGRLGRADELKALFAEALSYDEGTFVHLNFALGLARLNDQPRANDEFRTAVDLAPEGNWAALESYAEWLLDLERYSDAVNLLGRAALTTNPTYLSFLRGVALERLGRLEEAAAAYGEHVNMSKSFPVSSHFRIAGSPLQEKAGIHFDGAVAPKVDTGSEIHPLVSSTETLRGLSYLIYREAGGENTGGQRAEGWVVRNRVLRGTLYNSYEQACPYITNSGSALADRYRSVMCQGNGAQFNGVCLAWCSNPATGTCTDNSSTRAVSSDVYNGRAPDPVAGHCPGGITSWGGSWCSPNTTCAGSSGTFRLAGGVFNFGTSSSCPLSFLGSSCPPGAGAKVCFNGGLDNCFYKNSRYARSGLVTYSGTVNAGTCVISAGFSASGVHKGHLEGPLETTSDPDLNLYLQKQSGSSWSTVASSTRPVSVEDIEYNGSSGTYRWRICSYSGGGSVTLSTKRP